MWTVETKRLLCLHPMLSLTYTLGNIMLFYCINVQMCLLFLET